MSKTTTLATAQLNHSADDGFTIELVEDLATPAAVRGPALIIVRWPLRGTMCDPQRFPEAAATTAKLWQFRLAEPSDKQSRGALVTEA
jgi:hypothetical protein